MANLTIMQPNPDCVYVPIPKSLFNQLGWQLDADIEITPQDRSLLIHEKKQTTLTEKDKILLAKGAGMFTLTQEQAQALEGKSLFDFDVADHITLFDESDE